MTFNEWFVEQFGRPVPTIWRAKLLRERYDNLRVETERARQAWQKEHSALAIYDAALKGANINTFTKNKRTRAAAGAHARAKKLTPERRSEIARKAAQARWRDRKKG